MAQLENTFNSPDISPRSSSVQDSGSAPKAFRFLDLPFELRLKIYQYYILRGRQIDIRQTSYYWGFWSSFYLVSTGGRRITLDMANGRIMTTATELAFFACRSKSVTKDLIFSGAKTHSISSLLAAYRKTWKGFLKHYGLEPSL